MNTQTKRKIAGLCFLGLVIILAQFLPMEHWLERVGNIQQNSPFLAIALFVLIGSLAVSAFIPVSIPVAAAGVIFGFPFGLIPALLILIFGSAGGFASGRILWPRIQSAPIFSASMFEAFRKAIKDDGYVLLMLLRLTPFMHFMTANLFFGSLPFKFMRYLVASLIGMIPGTVLVVYGSSIASELVNDHKAVEAWQYVLFGLGCLLFLFIIHRISHKVKHLLESPQ